MTRQQLTLKQSEHAAISFVAARRVRSALIDQPPHSIVTAAKLVSEIVDSLARSGPITAIELDIGLQPGNIRITVSATRRSPDKRSGLDGLTRLLLDRLATAWSTDPESGKMSFTLAPAAAGRPEQGAA